jgi:hypothetical protein
VGLSPTGKAPPVILILVYRDDDILPDASDKSAFDRWCLLFVSHDRENMNLRLRRMPNVQVI